MTVTVANGGQFDPADHPRDGGGKFVATSTGETQFINEYGRGGGSFEFPPAFRNYDQLKEFYTTTNPSEETLRDFSTALREHWAEVNTEAINDWIQRNPGASHDEYERAQRQIIVESNAPTTPQIEALCRIRAMADAAQTLTPYENNRFWDDEFAIAGRRGGTAEIKTGEQFYDQYNLAHANVEEFRHQREARERQQTSLMAQQADAMNQQLEELRQQTVLLRELLSNDRVRDRQALLDQIGPYQRR